MRKEPIHSVYFSPTGTTRSVTHTVCKGTGRKAGIEIDLNRPVGGNLFFAADDPVVISMPVYGGRLPALAVERFKSVKGLDTPAAVIVVYGNRAIGDSLLELCDLCAAQGFKVTAAAAFIGKHSFSSDQLPIAADRPDETDLHLAEKFGSEISQSTTPLDIEKIPGTRPYKPEMILDGAAAETDPALCTNCGQGVTHCPANAIRMDEGIPLTDPERCIWCTACVRNCPSGARKITLPKIHEIAERLYKTCQTRMEPEWFLAQP